jgi:hypothetical protein
MNWCASVSRKTPPAKSLSENLGEYGKMKGKSGRGNNGKNQTVGSE